MKEAIVLNVTEKVDTELLLSIPEKETGKVNQ